jgi:hypothetical protein
LTGIVWQRLLSRQGFGRERAAVDDNLRFVLSTRMALILPKGWILNDPQIAGLIEEVNQDPLDLADIAKFWKGTFESPCQDGINMIFNSVYYNQTATARSYG